MQFNKALYLKELKQHRVAFSVYLILIVLVTVTRQFRGWDTLSTHNGMADFENPLSFWLNLGLIFFLPVVLVYSWYREEHDGTTYQLLSVPVSPSTILMNRFMAFLTVAVPVHMVRMLITIGTGQPLTNLSDPRMHIGWMVNMTLSVHITALSIACLVIAYGQEHRRHRLLAGLIALLAVYVAITLMPFTALAFLVVAIIAAVQHMKYRRFRMAAIIGVVCAVGAWYYGTVAENALVTSFVSYLFEPLACFGFMVYSVKRFETHVEV